MRNDLAGVAGQVDEQVEFLGCEVDGAAKHSDGVSRRIDDEVANLNGGCRAFRSAAQMGTNAGKQLLNAEWLGNVVVGSGVKGLDFGALVVAHGENHDRCGVMCAD